MHIFQPKHSKLKSEEAEKLLKELNISLSQLPKINVDDPCILENCQKGDIIRIERKDGDKISFYYRVVVE